MLGESTRVPYDTRAKIPEDQSYQGRGRLQSADMGLSGCNAAMCTDRLAVLLIPFEDHTGADGSGCHGDSGPWHPVW